jgi:hypothetical protein
MKKLLTFLTIIIITLSTFGQIKTSGTFETGYESKITNIYFASETGQPLPLSLFNEINSFYGLLDMSASYKGISLHTSNKTYFNKSNGISFKPI